MTDEQKVSGANTEKSGAISDDSNETRDRIKSDMLKYKDENSSLRAKIEAYEQEELERNGNLQDVISNLKERNKALEKSLDQTKYDYAVGRIESAIKQRASSLGCKDPDTLYRLIDKTEIKTVELDSKFNVNTEDIDGIINRARKSYDHIGLFGRNVKIADATPNSKPATKETKNKSLDEMSDAELLAEAEKLGLKRIK